MCIDGQGDIPLLFRCLGGQDQAEVRGAGAVEAGLLRPADADLGGAGVRAGAGNDYAGGEDVSVRSVPVLRGAGESVKTRLLLLQSGGADEGQ